MEWDVLKSEGEIAVLWVFCLCILKQTTTKGAVSGFQLYAVSLTLKKLLPKRLFKGFNYTLPSEHYNPTVVLSMFLIHMLARYFEMLSRPLVVVNKIHA